MTVRRSAPCYIRTEPATRPGTSAGVVVTPLAAATWAFHPLAADVRLINSIIKGYA